MVDQVDPFILISTWVWVSVIGTLLVKRGLGQWRALLPFVAVLVAVGTRAIVDQVGGDPLTLDTIWRGLAAGAVTVLSHSQFREGIKVLPPLIPSLPAWVVPVALWFIDNPPPVESGEDPGHSRR